MDLSLDVHSNLIVSLIEKKGINITTFLIKLNSGYFCNSILTSLIFCILLLLSFVLFDPIMCYIHDLYDHKIQYMAYIGHIKDLQTSLFTLRGRVF